MSQFFASSGQSIQVSASTSVLPMNIQDWFPLGLTALISLLSRDSQVSFPTPLFKSISSSVLDFLYGPILTFIHDYWKNLGLTVQTFVGKVRSLLFNTLSRFVMDFLPRSRCLLISFNFMAAVTVVSDLGAQSPFSVPVWMTHRWLPYLGYCE